MKLKQYLNELFNTNVPVKVTHQYPSEFNAEFNVNGILYEFYAGIMDNKFWDVSFQDMVSPGSGYDIEGGKKAIAVFSGVKKAMEIFLEIYNPKKFSFTSKFSEGSRVKLYDKFAKMIATKAKYKLKKSLQATHGDSVEVAYEFKK